MGIKNIKIADFVAVTGFDIHDRDHNGVVSTDDAITTKTGAALSVAAALDVYADLAARDVAIAKAQAVQSAQAAVTRVLDGLWTRTSHKMYFKCVFPERVAAKLEAKADELGIEREISINHSNYNRNAASVSVRYIGPAAAVSKMRVFTAELIAAYPD
jgi:hypothetical protein